jgi:hypothetical protein
MSHTETLPDLDWVRVDHGKGAVTLISENDELTLEIRAQFYKEDNLTELTITSDPDEPGHTSYTGAPGTESFAAVVEDLKLLAARRMAWEKEHCGTRDALPDDLDF